MTKSKIFQIIALICGLATLLAAGLTLFQKGQLSPFYTIAPMLLFFVFTSLSDNKSTQSIKNNLKIYNKLELISMISSLSLIGLAFYLIISQTKPVLWQIVVLIVLFLSSIITTIISKKKANKKQ